MGYRTTMPINSDKPHLWKADVEKSIDFYNDWFIRFAPETYREQRRATTQAVLDAFGKTSDLTHIAPETLRNAPGILPILRMVTAPPLARDRLMGLAHVSKAFIDSLEGKESKPPRLPKRMPQKILQENLQRLCDVIAELIDDDLLPWIGPRKKPSRRDLARAATVIADRMCGAYSDPIIRNEQERRQLKALKSWLRSNGYREITSKDAKDPYAMPPGTFAFRLSLAVGDSSSTVNIPVDCVVKRLDAPPSEMPTLIEAKSAGDATNTNKRRKEEAQKLHQLKKRYGESVRFLLYLCGYFEPGYLGYEAAEGIDWVWEHRTSDFAQVFPPERKKKDPSVKESPPIYEAHSKEVLEVKRAEAQQAVDASKSAEERNRLGQFSTPFPIASHMVAHALAAMPATMPITFLEPALGSGVFYSALLRRLNAKRMERAVGCEIDPAYSEVAARMWSGSGLQIKACDFVAFALDSSNAGQFSLLCTNPPYVRHHHLPADLKMALQAQVMQRLGLPISGLSGLYVYFVLLADSLLAQGAVATWLLPAEFLYVNYGRVLRDYLSSRVSLLSIHHFNPEEIQFDDALVSSCIVTYRKALPSSQSSCSISFGGLLEPNEQRSVPLSELRPLSKWTPSHFDRGDSQSDTPRLKDLFSVRRGIATGANDFFIIDRNTADEFDIPKEFLKPILPSPRYLRESIIQATADGLPDVPGFRFLLDCQLPPDEVQRRYPGLWQYLQAGVGRGIPNGYLCAQKEVWYYQERRDPAPFIASYMGRSNGSRKCPIRFFTNLSKAIVTNVFLNLYPSSNLAACLANDRQRLIEMGDALNRIPAECIFHAGRAYGGGLHKIEPKELLEVPLTTAPPWIGDALTRQLALI